MGYSHSQRLQSTPSYKVGLFLILQQILHISSGIDVSDLDLGQTITRVTFTNVTDIYVGGVNFVAQLTPSLELIFNLTIGPVKSAEHCAPYTAPCDNHVRILEIDVAHNMLLVCGSAYRGTCTLHSVTNIDDWYCLYGDTHSDGAGIISGGRHEQAPVIHFLPHSTITSKSLQTEESFPQTECRVAEFGSLMNSNIAGPHHTRTPAGRSATRYRTRRSGMQRSPRTSRTRGKKEGDNYFEKRAAVNTLNEGLTLQSNFIVAGNLWNPNPSFNPPIISMRSMTLVGSQYTVGYARGQDSKPVGLNVDNNISPSNMPQYKLSFTWEHYSYFLFLQQTTECEKHSPCIVTKISRTCHQPSSILPYVEIPLSCEKDNKKYRLLTSATLGTVGLQLEASKVIVPVLLMAFGNGSDPLSTTADPTYGSAICAMTLDYLDRMELNYVLDTCSDAIDNDLARHVSWIYGKRQFCQKETRLNGTCTLNTPNQYVQSTGFTEIIATAYIKDVIVTAIFTHTQLLAGSNQQGLTPIEKMNVFLLTNFGNFKQFSLRAKRNTNEYSTELESSLTEPFSLNESISSQPIGNTDHVRAIMYVATGRKITEFDLEPCLQFPTCVLCLHHPDICRWCPIENNCQERDVAQIKCHGATSNKCPPRLDSFTPKKVPTQGGSVITVTGADLGIQSQGSVEVKVCNQPCDNVLPNNHNITCRVPQKCSSCANMCNITVSVIGQLRSDGTGTSKSLLEYVTPKVTSVSPKRGPVSGGTVLTFHGQNLKIGSFTNITVDNTPCVIQGDTNDLLCRITEDNNRKPNRGNILLIIDNFNLTLNKSFEFLPDPKIDYINPNATIASGGVTVTVHGSNLKTVESLSLHLRVPYTVTGNSTNVTNFPSNCTVNATKMICTTPDVRKNFLDTTKITAIIGDTDLQYKLPTSLQMTIYADPMFFMFSDSSEDAYIPLDAVTFIVKGERIPVWINHSDIMVTIGNVTLGIKAVKSNQITCDVRKAIEMYRLHLKDNNNTQTEDLYFRFNDTYTTTAIASNDTDTINATTIPVVNTKTLRTQSWQFTTVFETRSQPFLYYANNHGTSSEHETRKNVTSFDTPESMNSDARSSTQKSTTTATRRSKKNKRSKSLKLEIKIKIGNLEKPLGYVTIGSSSTSGQIKSAELDFKMIAGASGAGLLLIVLMVVSCVMYVRAKKARALVKEQAFYMGSLSGSQHGSGEGALPSLKQILQSVIEPDKRADMDRLIINLKYLEVGKSIGSGNFGCVYEGFLSTEKDTQAEKVAVKTLQDPSSHNLDLRAFVQEAVIMREFQHPHVLGLIGLAEKEPGIPYVILPYMDNGDLLTFIRDSSVSLSLHDVIKFGADIASGMAYLSALKFVHRDLAARNCMLDDLYRVKVADFGLCRDIYEKGYYTSDNRKKLPVRWMAVESIEHGEYSSKSDVWSLGVVLWELLSRGVTPYPGVNGWDVINFLAHRRLAPPYFCPDNLYNLMMQCWAKDTNLRPDFTAIQTELLRMIGQSPNITDTIKRRRGDKLNPTVEKNDYPNVSMYANTADTTTDNQMKESKYENVNSHENAVIGNVLITIPKCYSHRDVSKTAAGVYIQLVDNYEPPPKFSNQLLRSMKKHIGKPQDRFTKTKKKDDHSKPDFSGYSCPVEQPAVRNSNGDVTDGRSRSSKGSLTNTNNRESNYYELEGTSMRSSAASENQSGWSMLNNTGSSASILDVQSRDSSMSASRTSTMSSLTVPYRPPSSTPGAVAKIHTSAVPDRSPDHKKLHHLQIERSGNISENKDLTHL